MWTNTHTSVDETVWGETPSESPIQARTARLTIFGAVSDATSGPGAGNVSIDARVSTLFTHSLTFNGKLLCNLKSSRRNVKNPLEQF